MYSFSGKFKEIQLIVLGVDVASGITPGYPRTVQIHPRIPGSDSARYIDPWDN